MKKLLLTFLLLTACEEPARTIVIEPGRVEYIAPLEVADLDPMPVIVAPSLPLAEREPARVIGWRGRCRGGFMTTAGGVKLSCRM